MEVMMLLEALEDVLDKANALPLSSKVIVNREELLEIIKDIRIKIPDEVKQAQWIKEERQKVFLKRKRKLKVLELNVRTSLHVLKKKDKEFLLKQQRKLR